MCLVKKGLKPGNTLCRRYLNVRFGRDQVRSLSSC